MDEDAINPSAATPDSSAANTFPKGEAKHGFDTPDCQRYGIPQAEGRVIHHAQDEDVLKE